MILLFLVEMKWMEGKIVVKVELEVEFEDLQSTTVQQLFNHSSTTDQLLFNYCSSNYLTGTIRINFFLFT